jgi:hypothetical protein
VQSTVSISTQFDAAFCGLSNETFMLASERGETAKIPAFGGQIAGDIIVGLGQTNCKLRR